MSSQVAFAAMGSEYFIFEYTIIVLKQITSDSGKRGMNLYMSAVYERFQLLIQANIVSNTEGTKKFTKLMQCYKKFVCARQNYYYKANRNIIVRHNNAYACPRFASIMP